MSGLHELSAAVVSVNSTDNVCKQSCQRASAWIWCIPKHYWWVQCAGTQRIWTCTVLTTFTMEHQSSGTAFLRVIELNLKHMSRTHFQIASELVLHSSGTRYISVSDTQPSEPGSFGCKSWISGNLISDAPVWSLAQNNVSQLMIIDQQHCGSRWSRKPVLSLCIFRAGLLAV